MLTDRQRDRIISKLQVGDVLITYESASLWPPSKWILRLLYRSIEAHQKREYGPYSDYKPTHVRVHVGGGLFFECTTPKAKYTHFLDMEVSQTGRFKIARSDYSNVLQTSLFLAACEELAGIPYDKMELLDFAISGILGIFKDRISILEKRESKYRVCSTGVAEVLSKGKIPFLERITSVTPAYFANEADWSIVIDSEMLG